MATSFLSSFSPWQRKLFFVALFVVFVAVDRIVKWAVLQYVPKDGLFESSIVDIVVHYNEGIAFGIPLPGLYVSLIFLILFVLLLRYYLSFFLRHRVLFALLLAGAVSNLIDRLLHDAVVDYIVIWMFPVFNLADVFIVVSIILLLLRYWRKKDQVLA